MKKIKKKWVFIPMAVLLILILAVFAIILFQRSSSQKGKLLEGIRQRGVLKVAVSDTETPFLKLENCTVSGMEAELAKRIADALGVQTEFIQVKAEILEEAAAGGEADISFGCVSRDDREMLEQSLEYGITEIYLIMSRDEYANTMGAFADRQMGVTTEAGSAAAGELNRYSDKAPVSYTDLERALVDLDSGMLSLCACSRREAETALKMGYRAAVMPELEAAGVVATIPKGDAAFLNGINIIIQQYQSDRNGQ